MEENIKIIEEFIAKIKQELKSQDEKWGSHRDKHPLEWNSVLIEEIGEVSKELNDSGFAITLSDSYEKELIQCASVIFRMYEQNRHNTLGRDYFKDDTYVDEFAFKNNAQDEFKFFVDEEERACLSVREGGELVASFLFDKVEFLEIIEKLKIMSNNVKQ